MCPGVNWVDFALGALAGGLMVTLVVFGLFVWKYDDDGGLG